MTDIALPYDLCPSKITWTLNRNIAVAESPTSRVTQEQGRAGDRWQATVNWENLIDGRAYALASYLDQVSKVGNYALLPVLHNELRSDFTKTESLLLTQGWTKPAELAKWGVATNLYARIVTSHLHLRNLGSTPGPLSRQLPVVPNYPVAIVLDIPAYLGAGWRLFANSGATALLDVGGSGVSGMGRKTFQVIPTTTLLTINIYASQSATPFAQQDFGDLQVYQVTRSEGASAGATVMGVKGQYTGDGIEAEAFKAGQFVTLETSAGFELKRLLEDVRPIGGAVENGVSVYAGGNGVFEPALRGAVAFNSTVYHHPWCRMRLASRASSADISAPLLHGFNVDFIEQL